MNDLVDFLARSEDLVILTGAGCSTRSGIPDYRSPGGAWTRHKPIYYSAFVRSADVRRFYWARSYVGWPRFEAARPNTTHLALAALEQTGRVRQLITQNVDDLHSEAGSVDVIQLHGRNRLVVCLQCGDESARVDMQERIAAMNGDWLRDRRDHQLRGDEADFAPDGDAELSRDAVDGFFVPPCLQCGGPLKPAVVFFGETVPPEKVSRSMDAVGAADALLVVGSSLTVWSGFRFVRRAADRGIPIAIINLGETRGDPLATLKVEEESGAVLRGALQRMGAISVTPDDEKSATVLT